MSGRPDRGETRPEDDLVRQEKATGRKRGVPVEPEVGAIDRAGEHDSDPVVSVRIDGRPQEAALELHGLGPTLDRQITFHDELVALAVDGSRLEAELRVSPRVEEIRRLEVAVPGLVERRDGRDVDCPLDGRLDRKSTRLNSSHIQKTRMPSSA